MSEQNTKRLSQVARKLNVGRDTIIEFLASKGIEVDRNPNAKITAENYSLLAKEFAESLHDKEEAESIVIGVQHQDNQATPSEEKTTPTKPQEEDKILIKNLSATKIKPVVEPKKEEKSEPVELEPKEEKTPKLKGLKVIDKIDLNPKKKKTEKPSAKKEEPVKKEEPTKKEPVVELVPSASAEAKGDSQKEEEPKLAAAKEEETISKTEEKAKVIKATAEKVRGLNVLGKIELPAGPEKKKNKPVASSDTSKKKRPRKRIGGASGAGAGRPKTGGRDFKKFDKGGKGRQKRVVKEEPTDKEIQEQIKATLARLSGGGGSGKKGTGAKYRKEKRDAAQDAKEEQMMKEYESAQTLQVAEFISANDLASLMGVSVNDVISTCMGLGMFVSINQRLDAEAITIIADEFHFEVEFASAEDEVTVEVHEDKEDELEDRAPIVTIMGHVDHGKTSLLDYIRKSAVTKGEAGGITQHIGAYDVTTESGHKIAFLDTPGHEAFTAMRARGTKITDVVIIVIAADDSVMPQTKEAINHAQVAGVPIIIAFNKMDRANANADKVREELSQMNVLVESWGGKYQEQEISAKTGAGIEDLLEKVLLESELLELKANPNKNATGSVIE
ncbi:Translation initiation factor 2, partial [hydrothermal vent metagenome]